MGAAQGFAVGMFNHAAHRMDFGKSKKDVATNKTNNEKDNILIENNYTEPKEKPFLKNNSNKIAFCKPENSETPFSLKPGDKTYEKVDGIKSNGIVYKITDGYDYVIIEKSYSVVPKYSTLYYRFIYSIRGGKLEKAPDEGWVKLFKSK